MTKEEAENLRKNVSGIYVKLISMYMRGKLNKEDFQNIDLGLIYQSLENIANEDEQRSTLMREILNEYETNIKDLQEENSGFNSFREKVNLTIQDQLKEIEQLRSENAKLQEIITSLKQPQKESNTVIKSDLKNAFNKWALNSLQSLPQGFSYVSGEIRRLTKQTFDLVTTETIWIVDNDKRILFPNPNFLDDVTDISEFYTMNLMRLKPKGKNRIKIIKPCEIIEDGFIRFQGELELL